MAGLLDFFTGSQAEPASAPAPAASGLSGMFKNYDLGSRLQMAAAFLQNNPGAAAQIGSQMYERQATKAQDARTQALIDSYISKNPAMAEMLRANPELIYKIMEQDRAAEADKAKTAEERAYAAQLKAEERAASPLGQFQSAMAPKIETAVPQGQMGVPGAQGPMLPNTPALVPKTLSTSQAAVSRALGLPDASQDEAGMLESAYYAGPESAKQALAKIKDDRRQAAQDQVTTARESRVAEQGTWTEKYKTYMLETGGKGTPEGFKAWNADQEAKAEALKTTGDITKTETIAGPDGNPHVMGWNPKTSKYDIDMGVKPESNSVLVPVDPNDPSKGMQYVKVGKGGSGGMGTIPSDTGARLGMAKGFLQDYAAPLRKLIESGDVTGMYDMNTGYYFGRGSSAQAQRMFATGRDALQRELTGAGLPASEASDYVSRYTLGQFDNEQAALLKLDNLQHDLEMAMAGTLAAAMKDPSFFDPKKIQGGDTKRQPPLTPSGELPYGEETKAPATASPPASTDVPPMTSAATQADISQELWDIMTPEERAAFK